MLPTTFSVALNAQVKMCLVNIPEFRPSFTTVPPSKPDNILFNLELVVEVENFIEYIHNIMTAKRVVLKRTNCMCEQTF